MIDSGKAIAPVAFAISFASFTLIDNFLVPSIFPHLVQRIAIEFLGT